MSDIINLEDYINDDWQPTKWIPVRKSVPWNCAINQLSDTDSAYLAGLLDGEGYFTLFKRVGKRASGYVYTSYETRIELRMTTKELIEEIAILVGGFHNENYKCGYSNGSTERAKPAYRLRWGRQATVQICSSIAPFIRLKKRHVELILAIDAAKRVANTKPYPQWLQDMQDKASSEFRFLNMRGVQAK